LNNYNIDEKERANINYVIGDIYFERLKDYENALAFYLKIKYLYPESNLVTEANKKIVACLERLQRSEDAVQALEETTSLEPEKIRKKRPGAVVARIGKREITQGDIDFEINQLPSYLKSQFNTKEKKIQFLKQYILTELLYDKAKREKLDKDPEIVQAAFQAKREIMVQRLLQKEISERVKIEPADVELYYNAHKDKYVEKDDKGNVKRQKTFNEVNEQVAQDLAMERQQEAFEQVTAQLMRAEGAELYEDVLR
jgi:EpsD family peptidyl-prolyl cis-trans isomerase